MLDISLAAIRDVFAVAQFTFALPSDYLAQVRTAVILPERYLVTRDFRSNSTELS